ncbi:endolytic transglycosylase MltG [Alteromonas confluentis]|uniref:Endolytic murein transglycosylase n=1 Tax=Alteromonas confluentis TaxID=1656094 RepID=A0A1E7ZGF6_9ALTE|nr:endolytic transglycosylase MltG [Alteromonas confluentis]OFC72605.1 ABC transporter substrate-binding protein [Alteromonas confluentis]
MKRLISITAILFSLLAFGSALAFWVLKSVNAPLTVSEPALFVVEPGSSAISVVRKLDNEGYADTPEVVAKIWLKLDEQARAVKAGTYQLQPDMSLLDALYLIARNEEFQFSVGLVEGFTLKQWLAVLENAPSLKQDIDSVDEVSALVAAADLVTSEGAPVDSNPEGLFLADTYHYTAGASVSGILKRANNAMSAYLQSAWEQRQPGMPYDTPYEALIMASIIEKETAVADERPLISGVFINRLQKDMRLQTDPTVIYGLGDNFDGNITRRHLREKNPYNTYTVSGLPPTPIAMPGKPAIDAALHPAVTDALYFVSRGDGTHVFSATLEQHNQAVNEYQRNISSK